MDFSTLFFGADTSYLTAAGVRKRFHYLDSTASTLMFKNALRAKEAALSHYGNIHSSCHFNARISQKFFDLSQREVLRFFNVDESTHSVIFMGSGVTAALNFLARTMQEGFGEKSTVAISPMEHHSNDLPHRKYSGKLLLLPLLSTDGELGCIDVQGSRDLIAEHASDLRYVSVTGVSNVTGMINPIAQLSEICRDYDVPLIVDGAQMVAHVPLDLSAGALANISALVFSSHKIYAPGGPGVIVTRNEFLKQLPAVELGGGMVGKVHRQRYELATSLSGRFQAGTPNILGAVELGCALNMLMDIGMEKVQAHERALMDLVWGVLTEHPKVKIYGSKNRTTAPRAGAISFNITGVEHGLAAMILNDYHCVAVRNECFCAHPYVRDLMLDDLWNIPVDGLTEDQVRVRVLEMSGMLRVSFGLYNTAEDVLAMAEGVGDIAENVNSYRRLYVSKGDGNFEAIDGGSDLNAIDQDMIFGRRPTFPGSSIR